MKKHLILLILAYGSFTDLKAQSVFPSWTDNPSWNVLECFWYNCSTVTYHYEYDTLMCNQSYSKVNFYSGMQGYFRSDSSKTTFRRTSDCMDKEYLLYDFSMSVGDTVYVGINLDLGNSNDTTAFILNQIDTVNYFGVDRQRFKMHYDRCNMGAPWVYMYWIRGIGSDQHPFYSFKCLCDFCEQEFTLLCMDSSANQLYQNTSFNTCDTTLGTVEMVESTIISVNPNPFENAAQIKFPDLNNYEIKIFNTSGQLIEKINGKHEIMIGKNLLQGIYFIQIRFGQTSLTKKLVKL